MKRSSQFRLITVSGNSGVGKSLLTQKLAEKIGWEVFSLSSMQRQNAKRIGLKISDIDKMADETHQKMDQEMIKVLKKGKNMILESRLAGWQARDQKDILKILCIVDFKAKIQRYADREKITLKQAEIEITKRDKGNQKKFSDLYDASDYLDPKYYNLVIDTTKLTPDEEADLIISAL